MGRVLLIYLTVKLKIFLGSVPLAEDHRELSFESACDVTVEKKEPCDIRWFLSFSS